ncbi:MAG TPA: GGDEF domain-containing protein [Solirubrobacteraceae bacterium]|nr:GGDEF domain-containing protein [Solirubrobacteraceae bacterium]
MNLRKRVLPRPDTPAWVVAALGVLALLVLAHLAHALLVLGGGASSPLFSDWLYDAVMVGCAAMCLARALTIASARAVWLALGASLACDAVAEVLASISESLLPDVQRALYACFYLGAYIAIVLLGRRRVRRLRASLWLDGLCGMLAVAALGASTLFAPVLAATHGGSVEAVFDLAYPLADVLMIAAVVGFAAAATWRVDRAFMCIAVGFAATAVADGAYLYEQAYGTYVAGTPQDTLWLAGALILACAAWQPDGGPMRETHSTAAAVAAPVLAGATAVGVLVAGNLAGVGGLSVWLAVATLVAVLLRLVVTLAENMRLIAANRELAHSDALTGLGNRRALFEDLHLALAHAGESAPRLLLLFDLNGFKAYNDTYGHPAGDALLARLARRLAERAGGSGGCAYRLGGDEFCALYEDAHDPVARAAALVDALTEQGEHFAVSACCGEALLGREARDAEEALRIADQRLYTQKMLNAGERRPSSREWVGPIRERASRQQRPAGATPRRAR